LLPKLHFRREGEDSLDTENFLAREQLFL
jgi:hypothetical protein